MKSNSIFTILIAAVITSLTSAQNGLPSCAQTCVTQFTSGSSIGDCSSVDIKCICSQSTFLSSIACCLTGKCSDADQQASVEYAQNLCETAGVTNLPSAVSCAASSSTTSGVGTASGSGNTATSVSVSVSAASSTESSSRQASSVTAGSVTASSSSGTASPTANAGTLKEKWLGSSIGIIGGLAAIAVLMCQ